MCGFLGVFCCATSRIIQLSVVCQNRVPHRTREGHLCLSSHLSVALPQSKVTLMPQAISQCISQDWKWCQRKSWYISRFSIFPLVASTYHIWTWSNAQIYDDLLVFISQRSGRYRQQGPDWLTLSLDSSLEVHKHFFTTLPAELRYA